MKVEVVYDGGRTYSEHISAGTARISQNAKQVIVQIKNSGTGTPSGKFTMPHEDAERLAHALLLACSAGDVNPVEFSVGVKKQAAKAA
jgi:hypothetical protein